MIKVIDKPISDKFADELEAYMLSGDMIWRFVPHITESESHGIDKVNYGFGHTAYKQPESYEIYSKYFFKWLPILYACDEVDDLIAMRSFLQTPSTSPGTINGIHVDIMRPHKVCLYYVNDSDGDTVFFDNEDNEIARNTPKKNTAVLFDGSIRHSSSSPSTFRCVINFDYL